MSLDDVLAELEASGEEIDQDVVRVVGATVQIVGRRCNNFAMGMVK